MKDVKRNKEKKICLQKTVKKKKKMVEDRNNRNRDLPPFQFRKQN